MEYSNEYNQYKAILIIHEMKQNILIPLLMIEYIESIQSNNKYYFSRLHSNINFQY